MHGQRKVLIMTKLSIAALAATMIGGILAGPACAADVGISINIGEPGFYGQLNIGDFPQPSVIYSQPVLIERTSGYASRPPIYLRVPPGHEKHWQKYCGQYDACGRPVYFVRDDWYQHTYAPRYREHNNGKHGDEHHGDEHHGDKHD
jgi:hypothetical protein